MSVVAFDTLKFAQTLREKAKFTAEQAEGLAEAFSQASADQLATKSDIGEVRSDLRGDIAEVRSDLRADIADVRSDLHSVEADLRSDLRSVEASLRADLRQTELRLEAAIKVAVSDSKAEIVKWVVGTVGLQTVVILGAVLALSRFGH